MAKTVRVKIDPTVSKALTNSTNLRNEMRTELRRIQETKPDIAKHQSRRSQ